MWCRLMNNYTLIIAGYVLKFNVQSGQFRPPSAVLTVIRPMIRYYRWRTKNRPAVSYTNVGVGMGLCTGN